MRHITPPRAPAISMLKGKMGKRQMAKGMHAGDAMAAILMPRRRMAGHASRRHVGMGRRDFEAADDYSYPAYRRFLDA